MFPFRSCTRLDVSRVFFRVKRLSFVLTCALMFPVSRTSFRVTRLSFVLTCALMFPVRLPQAEPRFLKRKPARKKKEFPKKKPPPKKKKKEEGALREKMTCKHDPPTQPAPRRRWPPTRTPRQPRQCSTLHQRKGLPAQLQPSLHRNPRRIPTKSRTLMPEMAACRKPTSIPAAS